MSRLVQWYLVAFRIFNRLARLSNAAFDGFALGFLDADDWHQLDQTYYSRTAEWRDTEYNEQGLNYWERSCVEKYFASGIRIAALAVGGGREALALAELGYETQAFECHDDLRKFANSLLARHGLTCEVAPIARDAAPDLPEQSVGAILVGWGSYMLISERRRRVAFLRGLERVLCSRGVVFFSFFAVNSYGRPLKLTQMIGSCIRRLRGAAPLELGDSLNFSFVHYFTQATIAEELEAAGFEPLYFALTPYGHCVARCLR